jgi:hypothetical protein
MEFPGENRGLFSASIEDFKSPILDTKNRGFSSETKSKVYT